jgi:hypothetical protein
MPVAHAAAAARWLAALALLLASLTAAAQLHPACARAVAAADAEFVPRIEALVRERSELLAGIPQVFHERAQLAPAGRSIARAYIGTVERNADDEQRVWLQHQAAIRDGLRRARDSDPAALTCIADFDAEVAETEPSRQRRYAATQVCVRALFAMLDAIEGMLAAVDEFGSSGRVPRTDPRYIALVSGMERMQESLAELGQAEEAFIARYRRPQAAR